MERNEERIASIDRRVLQRIGVSLNQNFGAPKHTIETLGSTSLYNDEPSSEFMER